MPSPVFDNSSGIVQTGEPMQVQALVPELTVEAFGERVLSRLTGLDEVQGDALPSCPEEHSLAGKLRTVVANDDAGQAPL